MKLTVAEIAEAVGVAIRIVQLRSKDWDFGEKREKGKGLCFALDRLLDANLPEKWVDALTEKFGDRLEKTSTIVDIAREAVAIVEPPSVDAPIVAAASDETTPSPSKGGELEQIQVYESEGQSVMADISEESDDDLRLNARYEILRLWSLSVEACKANGGKSLRCDEEFVDKIKSGEIEMPEWVRKGISSEKGKIKLSRALLFKWKDLSEAGGAAALRPKFKGKEGQGFFDLRPDYVTVAEALCREFGASAKVLHYAFTSGIVKEDFGLDEIPTESQIVLWLNKREALNKQRTRAFATGDKSVILAAQGSYSRGLQPNDKWEADSTKADATAKKENIVWLQSKYGEAPVRCALVACIDVATRMVKVLVRPTSNGEAIAAVVADCIRDWGLPKVLKTDNGKDYIGRHVAGFCRAMGIEQKLCVVKQPWQKPHIERFMRTLQHSPAWEMLPWNTGHNVAQQQAYRKRREGDLVLAWDIEKFQAWIDKWIENYHNSLHDGLGCTPLERLAAFRSDGWLAQMPKNLEKNLEFALLLEDLATVNKGGIKYQGRFYIAPELIELGVGSQVAIRSNPANPNQIYVYSSKDLTTAKLICIATWDMALTPEKQAQIASIKPVVSEADRQLEDAIKKARRQFKAATAKNPERLLPEHGGVAALRATESITLATQSFVDAIEAAANTKVETTDSPEMQAKRQEWLDKQSKKEAEKPVEEEIRTGHDWRRIWGDKNRSIEDTQWLLQTIDIGGFGGFVALIERISVDDMSEALEQELRDRVA